MIAIIIGKLLHSLYFYKQSQQFLRAQLSLVILIYLCSQFIQLHLNMPFDKVKNKKINILKLKLCFLSKHIFPHLIAVTEWYQTSRYLSNISLIIFILSFNQLIKLISFIVPRIMSFYPQNFMCKCLFLLCLLCIILLKFIAVTKAL